MKLINGIFGEVEIAHISFIAGKPLYTAKLINPRIRYYNFVENEGFGKTETKALTMLYHKISDQLAKIETDTYINE